LQAAARSRGLDNVVFEAPMSPDEVPAALASADAILVTLKHHIPGAVPSKIYEAMASERPLILVDEGEAAEIVRSGDAGVVVSPGQVGDLVEALEQVRLSTDASSRMTRRARGLACDRFDRAAIANRFIDRLENGLSS
jgi:glycosyltransferase involved in cell wall biosynthesis